MVEIGIYTFRRISHELCITIGSDGMIISSEQKRRKVMSTKIESVLYIDIQSQRPAAFCPVCGTELYAPSLICLRCERNAP